MSRYQEILKSLNIQDKIHGPSENTQLIRVLLAHTTDGFTFQNFVTLKYVKVSPGNYRSEYYIKEWVKPMILDLYDIVNQ